MDDPGLMDGFRPAPGGVMELARGDNTLSASQQEDRATDDWEQLRNAIYGANENNVTINTMNDSNNKRVTAGNDMKGQKVGDACKAVGAAECDENASKHMQGKHDLGSKSNVVPFVRPKVTRPQA